MNAHVIDVLTLTTAWALTWPPQNSASGFPPEITVLSTHCCVPTPQGHTLLHHPLSASRNLTLCPLPCSRNPAISQNHMPFPELSFPHRTSSCDSLPFLAPSSSLCVCSGSSFLSHLQQWQESHPEIQDKPITRMH